MERHATAERVPDDVELVAARGLGDEGGGLVEVRRHRRGPSVPWEVDAHDAPRRGERRAEHLHRRTRLGEPVDHDDGRARPGDVSRERDH